MDEQFMREAVRLAVDSVSLGGGPFGAVIVRDGRIVGRGTNRVTAINDPTAHAEVQAIRDACAVLGDYRLNGCELYVSCMPCPMCLAAAYWARIERIYYAADASDAARVGFDDVLIAEELGLPLAARRMPLRQLAIPESLEPLEAWQAKADRRDY